MQLVPAKPFSTPVSQAQEGTPQVGLDGYMATRHWSVQEGNSWREHGWAAVVFWARGGAGQGLALLEPRQGVQLGFGEVRDWEKKSSL